MSRRQNQQKKTRLNLAPRQRQRQRQSNRPKPVIVREVWAHNLEEEFEIIRAVVEGFCFVSMDTEFPGVVFQTSTTHHGMHPLAYYQVLKANVDALDLIQAGLTFADSEGNLPDLGTKSCYVWQFNFRDFDPDRDDHNPDSIALLQRQGIDFNRNLAEGIDSAVFAEFMLSSRVLCNHSVRWITFQSAYDFAYLVKIITRRRLPPELVEFQQILGFLFGGQLYDMKHIMRFCDGLLGGLESVGKALGIDRTVGSSHQAGSDSLLTWYAFKKMCEVYFSGHVPAEHAGVVYGLELNYCNQMIQLNG